MSVVWRQVTSVPFEPIVRSCVKEHDEDDIDGIDGADGAVPLSEDWTFEIVDASAPNDWRRETIDWIWLWVNDAACASRAETPKRTAAIIPTPTNAAANFAVVLLRVNCIIEISNEITDKQELIPAATNVAACSVVLPLLQRCNLWHRWEVCKCG